jgi:hypothetical protein
MEQKSVKTVQNPPTSERLLKAHFCLPSTRVFQVSGYLRLLFCLQQRLRQRIMISKAYNNLDIELKLIAIKLVLLRITWAAFTRLLFG